MKKYIIVFLLMVVLAVPGWATDIQVMVNGNQVEFTDAKPMLQNGITLIPLRFISEKLGAEVEWDGETQKIIITQGEKKIEMQVGVKTALVDGQEILFSQGPELIDGRTFVPLRFVSEALGANVEWDGNTGTVKITTDESIPVKPVETQKEEQTNQNTTVKEFEGQPFKPSDFPTVRGFLYGSDRKGSEVMYAKISDLPIRIGDYIIYDLEITDEFINVKQYSELKSPILFNMLENKILCRQRYFDEYMGSNIFVYNYPINFGGDNWETDKYIKNQTNLKKVSHFAFHTLVEEGYGNNAVKLLLIENPLFVGGTN